MAGGGRGRHEVVAVEDVRRAVGERDGRGVDQRADVERVERGSPVEREQFLGGVGHVECAGEPRGVRRLRAADDQSVAVALFEQFADPPRPHGVVPRRVGVVARVEVERAPPRRVAGAGTVATAVDGALGGCRAVPPEVDRRPSLDQVGGVFSEVVDHRAERRGVAGRRTLAQSVRERAGTRAFDARPRPVEVEPVRLGVRERVGEAAEDETVDRRCVGLSVDRP